MASISNMHLLVDISAHGLGHLAQTAPVLEALCVLRPDVRLTVRSAIPRERLARRIDGEFAYVGEAHDFGFVMHNAVDIDFAASGARYRAFHTDWKAKVALEADWLRAHRVDALLANVAYLPLAGAAVAGIPAAAMCSLNWADLFRHYFGDEAWAKDIHAQALAAYNTATFLRVTPSMPMTDFARRHKVGPIARYGRKDRAGIGSRLGIDASSRRVLVAMGGMEFRLPVENWPRAPDVVWLVPESWQTQREDVRAFDTVGIDFTDLLANVDAVITKSGYGTFAEAACNGVAVLYLERDDWPEEAPLATWLAGCARARTVTRAQLMAGDVLDALATLWRQPIPTVPPATGAAAAAEWLAQHLL